MTKKILDKEPIQPRYQFGSSIWGWEAADNGQSLTPITSQPRFRASIFCPMGGLMCEKSACDAVPISERQMLEQEFMSLYGELPEAYLTRRKEILDAAGAPGSPRPRERAAHMEEEIKRALFDSIHGRLEGSKRSALCLSGGGIRSATFALGVIQGLAKYGLLKQFDYVSTVSGGGYVGSWLSAWIHRSGEGLGGVDMELAKSAGCRSDVDPRGSRVARRPNLSPEPPQLTHLREYSSYLTPRLGFLGLDSWTLFAIYLRNLGLMWLMLVPMLAGIFMVPRIYVAALVWRPDAKSLTETILASTLPALIIVSTIVGVAMAVAASPRMGLRLLRRATSAASTVVPNLDSAPRRPDLRAVTKTILLPVFASALLISFSRAWLQPPEFLRSVISDPYVALLVVLIAIYSSAALLTYLMIWSQGSARKPRLVSLLLVLNLAGIISGFLAWSTHDSPAIGWIAGGPLLTSLTLRAHAVLSVPFILSLYFLVATVYIGLTSGQPFGDADREWWARLSGAVLFIAIAWLVISSLSLFGPSVLSGTYYELSRVFPQSHGLKFASAGLAIVVVVSLVLLGIAGAHVEASRPLDLSRTHTRHSRVLSAIPSVSAPIAVILLAMGLAAGVDRLLYALAPQSIQFWNTELGPLQQSITVGRTNSLIALLTTALATLALFAVAFAAGRFMNSNRLSLHGMYRDRLIRAFLGASNERSPDPFTGFDENDNLPMHFLSRGQFTLDELAVYGNPDDRIVQLAELIRWRGDKFWEYVWQRNSKTNIPEINKEIERAARLKQPPDPRMLQRPVFAVLNGLLDDTDLFRYTEFSDPEFRRRHRQIDEAFRALAQDPRPFILNRLILEELCRRRSPVDTPESRAADLRGDQPTVGPRLGDWLLKATGGSPKGPRPLQVINMALNLVEGKKLAWQQRKARSFTVSPLHCGFDKGYRASSEYGGPITLGTAMTISGAAATPNMGYHSSPAVTLLLTLFNVRLGWWLGNPARQSDDRGDELYRRPDPVQSIRPLIDEAAGRTNDESPYVYLSDGGHFENLGLYEMVRRRCHYIVVSDASFDPGGNLQDLAEAVRKIQVDLGIPITFEKVLFHPKTKIISEGKYCALGLIHYDAVDGEGIVPGKLIYLKPARHGNEPIDVYNQGETNAAFPNEPTSNQWFGESQFESYRRLGLDIVEKICCSAGMTMLTLWEFADAAWEANGLGERPTWWGSGVAASVRADAASEGAGSRDDVGTRQGTTPSSPYTYDEETTVGYGSFVPECIARVPERRGVYCLYDAQDQMIHLGTASGRSYTLRSKLLDDFSNGGAVVKSASRFWFEITNSAKRRQKEIAQAYKERTGTAPGMSA